MKPKTHPPTPRVGHPPSRCFLGDLLKGNLLRAREVRNIQLVLSAPPAIAEKKCLLITPSFLSSGTQNPLTALRVMHPPRVSGPPVQPIRPIIRQEFCTSVHRFAQGFEQNLIDGANGKHYVARRLNREALELYGSI